MQVVQPGELADPFNTLRDVLVREQCDALSIRSAIQSYSVLVGDFSAVGQFASSNEVYPKCDCNNEKRGLLLPLAIKIIDAGLTYTKKDLPGEWVTQWQLDNMALDSSELNFMQTMHFVQTHLVYIPIQVAVFALLDYHFLCDMDVDG